MDDPNSSKAWLRATLESTLMESSVEFPQVLSTEENNHVHDYVYRGVVMCSFRVNYQTYLCLPQAFNCFLKCHVGGLHTVYTKLRRLNIVPLICNVEQVRSLRTLGAIQSGVNRCKLITPIDFDALYDDCTLTSSRPGRPPKRAPTELPSAGCWLLKHEAKKFHETDSCFTYKHQSKNDLMWSSNSLYYRPALFGLASSSWFMSPNALNVCENLMQSLPPTSVADVMPECASMVGSVYQEDQPLNLSVRRDTTGADKLDKIEHLKKRLGSLHGFWKREFYRKISLQRQLMWKQKLMKNEEN